ncbi:MAG: hypothetical protein HC906_14040 [Bacteroidales bacterium]|nr:hypothetical protein [Bacteroidales bacterium]
MKRIFLYITFLFITAVHAQHHEHQPLPSLIIDTDCAIDDFRALSLLLSVPEIEIYAIIASEGTLMPDEGAKKISALLHKLGKESIPVISGKTTKGTSPAWREFNRNIHWAPETKTTSSSSFSFFDQVPDSTKEFTMLCLGTLTSAYDLMKEHSPFFKHISRIIWYTQSVYPREGFNYSYNKAVADELTKNPPVRMDVISNLNSPDVILDQEFFNSVKNNLISASNMKEVHEQKEVKKKLEEKHFQYFDELAASIYPYP